MSQGQSLLEHCRSWGVPYPTGGPLHVWNALMTTRYLSYIPPVFQFSVTQTKSGHVARLWEEILSLLSGSAQGKEGQVRL